MSKWMGLALAAMGLAAGCSESSNPRPVSYVPSTPRQAELAGKAELDRAVGELLAELYGDSPRSLRVPPGAPLVGGGRLLTSQFIEGSRVVPGQPLPAPTPATMLDPETGQETRIAGGYSLYRKHCLHCHGVSGDGNGPTAPFLWPRPRDYRPGVYKFTSTNSEKPAREDLRRTLRQGIANTSMPAFEALMTPAEIEQVLDYVIFLSLRGQTELRLVEEAAFDETQFEDPDQRTELGQMVVEQVISQWTVVDRGGLLELVQPEVARVEPDRESILRGRDLYLGLSAEKLQCAGCHGDLGKGNGPSFVPVEVFNQVVFRGKPITDYDAATQALWRDGSLDDWGEPLRPANINNGPRTDYKGGRRPVDLYRRIARGINGAKMPAHNTALKPEQIWDLVNFVLALPYQPTLLDLAVPGTAAAGPATGAAGGGQ